MLPRSDESRGWRWRTVATIFLALILLGLAMSRGARISLAALQTSTSTVFAVIGDYGTDDSNEAAVKKLVDGWSPSFVATVGDNFYSGAIDSGDTGNKYHESVGKYFCGYLKDVAGADTCPAGAAAANRFFPAMGNHDYGDATPSPGTYTGYFTLPGSGVTSSGSSGTERYYDFVQGPVHFFVLNSNTQEADGASSSSVQAHWLQSQLAVSASTWNIVLFHHPPYSSDTSHGSTSYMQWPFAQWGADAVLSGHAHDYERIVRDGIVYFVNGLGGASRYAFGTPVTGSAFRYNAKSGAQRVTATDTSLTFEFISVDGVVQDTYAVAAGQAPTPMPTPTGAPTPTATQPPGGVVTVSFQDGSAPDPAYAGGDDTYLSQSSTGSNFGGASKCLVDGDDPQGTHRDLACLLRWDLSSIPAGSTVTAASITLNVTNASTGSYSVYQVLEPWLEPEATWEVYANALPWGAPGAMGSQDRGTVVLGTIAASKTGLRTFSLDSAGIAVVQSWINSPQTNHGVIIADGNIRDGADFSSNETTIAENRPKLTVQYAP
jgi:hypothetical protein